MFPFVEAFKMAVTAIWSHKLRSALTLVGIIAGVASIIAVMTGISVVQGTIEKEMSVLGTTVFQVQKWGRGFDDVDWREIQKRKPVTVENAAAIRENVDNVTMVGSELWDFGHSARYRNETAERVTICGGTPEYPENNTHYVYLGRNISHEDVKMARNTVVIGYAIAERLFPYVDPIDKVLKIDGFKYRVVGVFEEKKSAMGGGYDNYILMPISKFTKVYGSKTSWGDDRSVNVTVRVSSPELVADAIEETRFVLRQNRKVPPQNRDDFTIFTNDSQIRSFNQATAGVKAGAFVIGIIALVVAGIGIMNIMLVSVTERTKEIGIRKSLGAKRKHILLQFLLEAIILCNIGGVFGVMVGFGLGNVVTIFTGFAANVPMEWAVGGLVFCTTVGLIFGMWPAVLASRLDPIDALRYE
ncbi:MAG: ABC transporter permease [Calditrichaeota bacterium]|nr:ABC transporter permease [Calditrichota bacterium]MCB0267286.1 ABC transporter permease [Calditrichota bacterium]MCB0300904.1 ABC transporter permease [Calditrichota bacterium]MCB9068641.1 ABC transporter permease [Calditrichia bacterium]